MRKRSLLIRISLSVLAILFLYRSIDLSKVLSAISSSKILYIGLCLLMIALNYIISGFRWRSLIFFSDSFKGKNVFKLIKLYFIGAFFNNFMPTSIGGDVYKAYILGKNTDDMPKAAAATFVNRLSGLVILALFSTVSLILLFGILGVLVFVGFWVLIAIGFVFLTLSTKFIPKLKPYNEALHLYRNHKIEVAKSLGLSVLVQIVANLGQYFAVTAVGISVTIPQAFFAFPIIGFLSFLPVTFNGFGLQDWLYRLFLGFWGISATLSVASSVIYHLCRVIVSLVGGAFLLVSNDKNQKSS